MLILTRKKNEAIMIGNDVEVAVVDIRGGKVRLGVRANKSVVVHRKEVYEAIRKENLAAVASQAKIPEVVTLPAGDEVLSAERALEGQKESQSDS